MAINKKLIHFKTKAAFEAQLAGSNILGTSIVFIQDANLIWTHGTYYCLPSEKANRLESYTTATTVASLDVNYQTIYVTLSENASLSASGTGSAYNGRSITAYVYTSSSVTITIPTSGDYVSMCGSSFTTTADGWVEFSLVCVNGVWHIAKLEAE